MFRRLRTSAVALAWPFRASRRRPRLALAVVAAVVLGVAASLVLYVRYQWLAAKQDIAAGRAAQARSRLNTCLRFWPWDSDFHLAAARAARLDNDPLAAERHLNRCIELRGGATKAVQLEFLLVRVQTGDLDQASPALLECVEQGDPESPLILETLSRAFIIRLRYWPAFACLNKWIEIQPDAALAHQWRAFVLERLNNHKAALADYRRAVELDPGLVPARLRLAEMHLEDKQAPEAAVHLEHLLRTDPDNPLVTSRLGICRFLQGRLDEARRLMEAAEPHIPKDPTLLVNLARLELQEGRATEAERWLRRALAADPTDVEALFTLASALQLQGKPDEAAETLKQHERAKALVERANQLLRDVPDSKTAGAEEYAELGDVLLEAGQRRLGVYWLERALTLNPDNQRAHRALAAYYEKQGDAARAASHRRQVRDPAP